MLLTDKFKDEDGEPIKIQFKDHKGLKLLLTKLKNHLKKN